MYEYTALKTRVIHNFVETYPDSYVGLYQMESTARGSLANYERTYPTFQKLSQRLQQSELGKELNERLLAKKSALYGKQFIEVASKSPSGVFIKLIDLLGENEYVFLDFWASWCGPCRKENPHVVRSYEAFKDKGFTVLSVSLDEDASKWKTAIEKDGMPWYHVSDLLGWKDAAAQAYGVRAIPQNCLIRKDGTVVAANLRGDNLFEKIESLLR